MGEDEDEDETRRDIALNFWMGHNCINWSKLRLGLIWALNKWKWYCRQIDFQWRRARATARFVLLEVKVLSSLASWHVNNLSHQERQGEAYTVQHVTLRNFDSLPLTYIMRWDQLHVQYEDIDSNYVFEFQHCRWWVGSWISKELSWWEIWSR